MEFRYLSTAELPRIRAAFNQAFADYFVDCQLSEEQLQRHLAGSAVDLELSVGAYAEGVLVGLLLNGIDGWNGSLTAYDAGTGVVPAHRGRGLAGEMFRVALPRLRERGVKGCLLEVILDNEPALRAYRRLGFEVTREVVCLRCPPGAREEETAPGPPDPTGELHVEPTVEPEWTLWRTFRDWEPTWQNSEGSLARMRGRAAYLRVVRSQRCVGYAAFDPAAGRLMQIGVDPTLRRGGVGRTLLAAVRAASPDNRDVTVLNVDASASATIAFLQSAGFEPTIRQLEMVRAI